MPDGDISVVSVPIPEEPYLLPLTSLPLSVREQRRLERDRILDLLEQEEEAQQSTENLAAQEERREALLKRKENAQSEIEKLKAAREMQKKMGKALLRNMADAREREEMAQKEALSPDSAVEGKKKMLKAKKSVSFADLPEDEGEDHRDRAKIWSKDAPLDWGDIAPARLRSTNKSKPTTKAQMNRLPMKLDVVERMPTVNSQPEMPAIHLPDSDDESEPPSSSNESDSLTHDGEGTAPASDSDTDDFDFEDEVTSDNEEFDLDVAQHHREIALAYHEKRNVIGAEAANAMTSHTHHEGEDDWDQPVCVHPSILKFGPLILNILIGGTFGSYAICHTTEVDNIPV